MGQSVVFFATAFLLSIISAGFLTWLVREISISRGWVTLPSSNRHVHVTAIPRLGGVAIYCTFIVVSVACLVVHQISNFEKIELDPALFLGLTIPATLLFLVGLVDDILDIRPVVKLFFQVVAGVGLYVAGLHALDIHLVFLGLNLGSMINFTSTVFWVIAISNAVNLIDGLDGLAAGSTLFSIVTIFVMAVVSDKLVVALIAVILAGALIGFLKFNFHPASIFLGDSGSLFIGFMLSGLALAGRSATYPAALTMIIPIVAFGFPLVETGVSVLRRFISGKKIFEADRAHFHHRLLELGLTQRQVVAVLYGFSALCALLSIVLMYPATLSAAFVLTLLALVIVAFLRQLRYPEFREFRRIVLRTIDQRHIIANSVAIRGVGNKLETANTFESIFQVMAEAARITGLSAFELVISGIISQGRYRGVAIGRSLHWSRPNTEFAAKEWSFSIQLTGELGDAIGLLRIHEWTSGRILFDFNALFCELGPSLAQAVERAMIHEAARPRTARVAVNEIPARTFPRVQPTSVE